MPWPRLARFLETWRDRLSPGFRVSRGAIASNHTFGDGTRASE